MSHSPERPYQIAVFTADLWEHVCPSLRIVEPLLAAGMQLLKGNNWENGSIHVFPYTISDADLVIIQRDFPRYLDEYESVVDFARKSGIPIIYELDDLLLELPNVHPDLEAYLETRPSILRAALEADAITTSTSSLFDYLKPYNPNIWLLQNFLIDRFWKLKEPEPDIPENGVVTIGYMGGHGHIPDMEMIYPALQRILDRYEQKVQIKFWGLRPSNDFMNRPNVSWTHPYLVEYAAFADYFMQQTCDIFIAPLQDNLFNRCKSGIKFLEYSSLGVPGVYSDLPPYNELILHRQNGLLASTNNDWEESLSKLIENAELRRSIANEAQKSVNQKWLLSQNAFRWQEAYGQILESCGSNKNVPDDRASLVIRKTQKWYVELSKKTVIGHENNDNLQDKSNDLSAKSVEPLTQYKGLEINNVELQAKIAEQRYKVKIIQQKFTDLEKENVALETEIFNKEREIWALSAKMADFQNGATWKLFLRTRLALLPRNSPLEKSLRRFISALRIWRSQGFRSMASTVLNRLKKNPPVGPAISSTINPEPPVAFFPVEGNKCSLPAISVIQILGNTTRLETKTIQKWLHQQTWEGWELIMWDQFARKAWDFDHPVRSWEADSVTSLIEGLSGKYLCVASQDLMHRNDTYLEANIIALESERLAFTLNLNSKADWVRCHLGKGYFPGTRSEPLQRMLVNVKCLGNNFTLDPSLWLARQVGKPVVIGKIITHTTTELEIEGLLEFNNSIANATTKLIDPLIASHSSGNQNWGQVFQPIHPVDSVLPAIELSSEQPTILVFMPFLAVGGAERVALDMIRCLKSEVRFVVLTLDEHDPAIGTTVDLFRELTPYVYTAHDFLNRNLNFSLVNYLIERFHPFTFYIANGSPWIYDALFTIKNFHPELRLANQVYDHQAGWINRYDPILARILDANIGVNKKICDAFIERGAREQTIYQIENGVNTAEFDPGLYSPERRNLLKQKFNIKAEDKVIVFMARLHPQKRPMDFVEVARRCKDEPNLHFLMVGDGPLGKTIDDEIVSLAIKNITHVPFYRPSSDIYAISDVFVLPSEYEGMPMVILEAQSMGKPVVITDVGNNREVLDITQGGVLLNKIGDISAIKLAILKLLEEPPDPLAVRQAIIDKFSLEIMGNKYRSALLGH
jgi:processive 1,2-diacylglycerol beta-glucosyltransferase